MSKKVISFYLISIVFGCLMGMICGLLYGCYNPMHELNGYWKNNYFFTTPSGEYFINSRVSIIGREIIISADIYDKNTIIKGSRNLLFRVVDIKNNIFNGEITSMIPENVDDDVLNLLLKNPFLIIHPTFYVLDNKTVLMDQSQGYILSSVRMLQRDDKACCH